VGSRDGEFVRIHKLRQNEDYGGTERSIGDSEGQKVIPLSTQLVCLATENILIMSSSRIGIQIGKVIRRRGGVNQASHRGEKDGSRMSWWALQTAKDRD